MAAMPSSVLGFDFGLRRIGCAVGQSITQTASPLPILSANQGAPDWTQVDALMRSWKPTALVVGMPIKERETDTVLTEEVTIFVQQLSERYGLPVHTMDERFSTREARAILQEKHGKSFSHEKVDSLAACLIVESWFSQI